MAEPRGLGGSGAGDPGASVLVHVMQKEVT